MKKKSMKSADKFKEKMPPSKKQVMKGGKQVAGRKYSEVKEEYDDRKGKLEDNHPSLKPADISGALRRAKEGYSKKPRVKPDKMKGKGK